MKPPAMTMGTRASGAGPDDLMGAPPRTTAHRPTGRRQHICVVTETYPPEINGVALTLARLVNGMRARGHAVSLVRPHQRALDGAAGDVDPDVTVVRGVPLPWYGGVRIGVPARGLLRDRWTRRRPDGVYVATEGPLGWSAVQAARELGLPVLSGFHTNFHRYARHYHASWLRPLVFRYLRRFHNRTLVTLVASADLRDQLHATGFRNLRVLGRGVDCQLFTPARRSTALRETWGVSEGDLVVLYVGRIAPEKNVQLAIEAYRGMQRMSRSLRFVIVGDGPLRAALQPAHSDLHFCGVQFGEQLAVHYASADVFLFPSETETFGNVTLEAMASGLGVVAYDYAAARMHIAHGQTGVLVPHGASSAFVETAVALARSPHSLPAMRRRAREYAAGLDWENVVDQFEMLQAHALAERSVAPAAAEAL